MSQPKIFVINLDRSPDRLELMSQQLSGLGIDFERFPAIAGRNLPGELAEQFATADLLSDGEVGCYASHLSVAKRVVDEKLSYATVLEDDVTVKSDLEKSCAEVANSAPDDWHIIHIAAEPKRSAIRLADLGTRELVKFSRVPTNAAGYMISYAGAQKLIAPRTRALPIDVEVRHYAVSGLDVYGVMPSLVVQNTSGVSMIGTGRHWRTYVTPTQKLIEAHHLYSKVGLLKYLAVTAANMDGAMRRCIFGEQRIRVL